MLELITFSTLNGVLYGMLLFMMASGLTLIFSMMGVLNFAHASFYMLGAYLRLPDQPLRRLLAGADPRAAHRGRDRRAGRALRAAQRARYGHVAELLFTFGLAFVIEELVQMFWGKLPVDYRVPPSLDFTAFTALRHELPRLQAVHAADLDRDVRVPARGADHAPASA